MQLAVPRAGMAAVVQVAEARVVAAQARVESGMARMGAVENMASQEVWRVSCLASRVVGRGEASAAEVTVEVERMVVARMEPAQSAGAPVVEEQAAPGGLEGSTEAEVEPKGAQLARAVG